MKITIFSLGGLLGQYVTNTALLHGAQVTAYVPDAKAIWPRKNLTVIEGSLQNRERVLEALLAFTEANFTVKKRDLSVALDYQIERPRLTVEAACSISVAQLLSILWPILKEAIRGLRKRKKTGPSPRTTKQRAAAMAAQGKEETHGKESSCQ